MKEAFLHYVWEQLQFDFYKMTTTTGERVYIKRLGKLNTHQGPDFLDASVMIDEQVWAGSVEMHLSSAEWYAHGHHTDEKYNNVVLHVVRESTGQVILRQDGTLCPEVAIGALIPEEVLGKYEQLSQKSEGIPCHGLIQALDPQFFYDYLTQQALGRMEEKLARVQDDLRAHRYDWEETAWRWLMRYMGGTLNGHIFEQIAEAVPFAVLKKYLHEQPLVEALLFGTYLAANRNALTEKPDYEAATYVASLDETYTFLKQKHDLQSPCITTFSYLRMRPAAFPDLRLAQVAALLHLLPDLAEWTLQGKWQLLLKTDVCVSDYWQCHERLGKAGRQRNGLLGKSQKENLIVNVCLPLYLAYVQFQQPNFPTQTLICQTLSQLKPEYNHYTAAFESLSLPPQNSLHSQGMIALKKTQCETFGCLQCELGKRMLSL